LQKERRNNMARRDTINKIKPEIIYLSGNALIPPKAFSYKLDSATKKPIEKIKPRTHKFENELNKDLKKELTGIKIFPTKNEVFVSILHGINSEKQYLKCDLDNRAKTILDALKKVVYLDDSQVKILWTEKEFLKNAQENFYRISVKILDENIIRKISSNIKHII